MEVDVIIERDKQPSSRRPEPRKRVPANGQEDEGHVKLQCLRSSFCGGQAVAHHLKRGFVPVLDEFPGKQNDHSHHPKHYNPHSLPVLLDQALHTRTYPAHQVSRPDRNVLAPTHARRANGSAVVHVSVSLQQ